MGIFVKDSNINTGTVGSQGTNTQSVTVHNTKVDVSNIERGNSDINTESQVTTVDLGDLINEGTSTAAEAANTTITNGNINVGDTTQTASQTSNQNMQNSNTNTENINQQGESVTKHSIDNDQTKQDNVNQETGTASSKSASTGGQGGSTNQPTGTASKPASSSTGGKSGSSSGGQGGSANSGSMSAQGKQGAQGQKAGEVSGKAGSIKNTQSKVLELGGDVSRTGATISNQKSITSKTKTTQGNSNKAHSNTGSKIGKGVRWFVKEIVHTVESIRATEAVLTTTVMSAAGRILEKVFIDGLVGYVVAGVMDLAGEDDIANDLRKFAARNLVEEANTWFYENTEMGRHINELSAIKYDSELAKKIESFSETAIKIAASTAISLVPGGVFILAAVGALEGMGGAAESAYQNALANGEEDLTLSLWSNLGILGSGALDAVAWIFNAKLGKGFLSIAGDIGEIGLKETAINFGKQLFSKETLHNILDPKNLLPNMGQSALQSGEEIGRIFSKYMNGEELTAEDWWKLAKTYGTYLFLNIVEDVLTDTVQDYKNADQIKQKEAENASENTTETPKQSREKEVNEIKLRAEKHGATVLDTTERKITEKTLGDPPYTIKTDMTDDELIKYYNDFLRPPEGETISSLDEYPQWGVPTRALDVEVHSDGRYETNWVDNNGFLSDADGNPICEPVVFTGGEHMDRYGTPNGCFTGKMENVDGIPTPAPYEARSLPYAEGSQLRTEFVVNDGVVISGKTMTEKVNSLPKEEKIAIIKQMQDDRVEFKLNPDGTVEIPDVQVGKIAPGYGYKGGGTQYQFPIRLGFLEDWGWVKKVE